MAVRSFLPTVVITAALLGVSACSPDAATEKAEAAAAPVVSIADTLSPEDLMLRALECRLSLMRARAIAERLPADTAQALASAPDNSFLKLIERGGELGLSTQARQSATNAFRHAPTENQPVTDDYAGYIKDCAAIATRAAQAVAE